MLDVLPEFSVLAKPAMSWYQSFCFTLYKNANIHFLILMFKISSFKHAAVTPVTDQCTLKGIQMDDKSVLMYIACSCLNPVRII